MGAEDHRSWSEERLRRRPASAVLLRAPKRLVRARTLALVSLALFTPLAGPRGQSLEPSAKANDLYMLAQIVAWPANAFASPTSPFVICLQGPDPFQGLLDRIVARQRIDDRPILVERLAKLDSASRCHLAYLAGSAAQSRAAALDAVRGAPVLTVTDDAGGPGPRGIVHFVLAKGRVGFEVDMRLAETAGVTVSSKLLALAVRVVR